MLSRWYLELSRRNELLARSGGFCFLIGIILVILPFLDSRVLLGAYIWTKPAKFFLSAGIFFWTMGWLMDHLENVKFVKRISWGIWVIMVLELTIITYQASLGKLSHFNTSSLRDGILFQIMGTAIFLNSALVFLVFLKFLKSNDLPEGYLMGIKIGMVIFLIAGFEGFAMAANLKHTIGAPDGQEGLPFLGWAKEYGDLRIFHFLGLHALQVVPLLAWVFFKDQPKSVLFFGLVYFLLSFGTLWMALQGKGIATWF